MRIGYFFLPAFLMIAVAATACEEPGSTQGEKLAATAAVSETAKSHGDKADVDAIAGECAACHSGPMGFSGKSADDTAKAIAAMASGDGHPTALPKLSGDEIAALAAALTK